MQPSVISGGSVIHTQPAGLEAPVLRTVTAPVEGSLPVLLVGADSLRRSIWLSAILALDPLTQVESFATYSDAMLCSTRLGPHCLVIDTQEDSLIGAAVRRYLDRSSPCAKILWVGQADATHPTPSLEEVRDMQCQLGTLMQRSPHTIH
jgi:hypothetical protein